jgi:hypothetical protein
MEASELENHRQQLVADVRSVVEKYRAIFGWEAPEIDQASADRLMLGAAPRARRAGRPSNR